MRLRLSSFSLPLHCPLLAAALLLAAMTLSPFHSAAQIISPQPIGRRHIYSETANPRQQIATALAQARRQHKRVILDFGGDWCGDCQVLDIYFHQSPNAELLDKHFILVPIWVGHIDTNLAIPEKYGIAIHKGVPALAVLAPSGALLYAQKNGEFEKMSHMSPASVTEFLNKWKN